MEQKQTPKYIKVLNILGILVTVIAIIGAIYIMIHNMGLASELDFGAGAYYYADMPGFEKYIGNDHFTTKYPLWFFIALFLSWGFLMYRLWVFLDKTSK